MSGLSWRERLRRMNQRSLFAPRRVLAGAGSAVRIGARMGTGSATDDDVAAADAPSGDGLDRDAPSTARAEAVQRLQVGLAGIGTMVLLVGLASVIGGQADRNDQLAVPEAAPTTEPSTEGSQANPLADAGVVPDIGAQPSPSSAPGNLDLQRPAGTDGNDPAQR